MKKDVLGYSGSDKEIPAGQLIIPNAGVIGPVTKRGLVKQYPQIPHV